MKKFKVLILGLLLVPFLNSCINTFNNGLNPISEIEEEFYPDDFDAIEIGSAFEVEVVPGAEYKVTVIGDSRDIEDVKVRVINNDLKIDYVNNSWSRNWSRNKVEVYIESPGTLVEVEVSGAANMKIEDFSAFNDFAVDLSGASELELKVEVLNELEVDLSGASKIYVKESARIIKADVSGASKLEAYDADAEEAYLDLSGASKAYISVSEYLAVEASGVSVVNYKGAPRTDLNTSGGSKVENN